MRRQVSQDVFQISTHFLNLKVILNCELQDIFYLIYFYPGFPFRIVLGIQIAPPDTR